ncbi:MAG: hypothetical protein EOO27_38965 [Comamonadaceae bacterium]|nr:MAG: hypothetical protein EOO27_38965 [Comamonadaceae bacterium]
MDQARDDVLLHVQIATDPAWAPPAGSVEAKRHQENMERAVRQVGAIAKHFVDKAAEHRKQSARGGKLGAATRDAKALDPARVEKAARELGWPEVTKGIYGPLAERFDRTREMIGIILRARLPTK